MTSDHHKWTQVKSPVFIQVKYIYIALANKNVLDHNSRQSCLVCPEFFWHQHIAQVFSVASVLLCFRMTNYSWRVSWYWPQLNLCAWTPPFLSPAQPTACSTTSRKWTLAPWNGTEYTHALSRVGVSSFWIQSCQRKKTLIYECFSFWNGKHENESSVIVGKKANEWNKSLDHFKTHTLCIVGVSRGTLELHWTGSRSCPICPCHHSYDSTTTYRGGRRGNLLLS